MTTATADDRKQLALAIAKSLDSRNGERRNYWGELALWSTRRLGELIAEGKKKGTIHDGKRPPNRLTHDGYVKLKDISVDPQQSSRAQKLAALSAVDVSECRTTPAACNTERMEQGFLGRCGH